MATIRRKKGIEPLGPGLAHRQMRFAATLDAAPTSDWCNAFIASSLRFASGPPNGAADFFVSGDQVTFETTARQVAPRVPRGGEGTHRRDPDGPRAALGMRPSAPGHCRHQAGRRAPRRDP
jgi:hypothetical protein